MDLCLRLILHSALTPAPTISPLEGFFVDLEIVMAHL